MGIVIVQLLVISTGASILRSKFKLRIMIALVLFVADLIFGTVALASGRFEEPHFGAQNNLFGFSIEVSISVFFLAAASALTLVSALRLVRYKVRGEVANDQAQFIETMVMGTIAPLVVISMTEKAREGAVQLLLTILPQMGVLAGPLLIEYAAAAANRLKR